MDSKTTEQLDKIEQTINEIQELIRDMNTQVSGMVDLLTNVRAENNKPVIKSTSTKGDIYY